MHHIDSQENAKNIILSIEENFPVDTWKIDAIHLWPYIRIKLYFELLTIHNKKQDGASNTSSAPSLNKVAVFFKIIKAFFASEVFFFKLKQKKILFFGAHFHRVLNEGKYFNRFYDSIISHHNLQDDVYMVEYQKVYENMYNANALIALSKQLDYYKLVLKLKRKGQQNKTIQLAGYDTFCTSLSNFKLSSENLGISINSLKNWVLKMHSLNGFYSRLYKKTKPSKIVFLGYYGYDDLYGALITANTLKIKTIDFQHGPQTNVHMAFSNWLKVPNDGFNTMPKSFWNWDNISKANIDAWANKIQGVEAKVIGQPYVAYWMNKHKKLGKVTDEKTIIYSMQTSPLELFTPQLIRLIQQSKYTWVLRLHPRNDTNIEAINSFLINHGILKNTVIQSSVEKPLPLALNTSFLHVTNYSGCTIEAKMMGVPTVLIHQVGLEMFGAYIDNKAVYFLDQNSEDFELKFNVLVKKSEKVHYKLKNSELFKPI